VLTRFFGVFYVTKTNQTFIQYATSLMTTDIIDNEEKQPTDNFKSATSQT